MFITYLHVQSWIQENTLCLYLKYNTISIIQNLTQANSCIVATETSFGTDKPSIGISKRGGVLNFGYHMFNFCTSSISLMVKLCKPYMLGHAAEW